MKIVKNISENIDKYIAIISIVLSLIIPLTSWLFYKYSIKHKYKRLKLSNNKTRILKDMINAILFFPIMSIYLQIVIIILSKFLSKKFFKVDNLMKSKTLFLGQLIIITLPIIVVIFKMGNNYIAESKRLNQNKIVGMKAFTLYGGSVAIGIYSIVSSVLLLILSYYIDRKSVV